jgi:hypothetical protein
MPDSMETQDLRHAVLHALAIRPLLTLSASSVLLAVRRLLPFKCGTEDVRAALRFHVGLGHVEESLDPFGAEQLYQVTSAGTLAYERDPY